MADACRGLRFQPRSLGRAAEPSAASPLVMSVASVSLSAAGASHVYGVPVGEAWRGGV